MPDESQKRNSLPPLYNPPRANALGVGVNAINMAQAVELAWTAVESRTKGYICVTGVHGIMESQRDAELRHIQNASFLTVPDGMPIVWVGKLQGHRDMGRVYGPDFMLAVCKLSQGTGFTHFFLGGKSGTAELLRSTLTSKFPGLHVVGTYTPPFRPLGSQDEAELIEAVARSRPDFLWVGMSTPKQERFMAQYLAKLDTTLMVGVGAAFDIHTGSIKDSPAWLKKAGLQWLHRLCQEPRRLWKRYIFNNPKFLVNITLQLLEFKHYPGAVETQH